MVAALSSGLIVHGQNARQQVIDTWRLQDRGHFAVIPHANYIGDYPNHIDRAAARGRLGVNDSRVVFLFLGAVRPYKGVLELIQAFQQLGRTVPSWHRCQPLNEEFRRKIERPARGWQRTIPSRFVPDDQIQVYMNAADVVVLPYRHLLSSVRRSAGDVVRQALLGPAMGCLTDVLDDRGAFLYDPASETGLLESMRRRWGGPRRCPQWAGTIARSLAMDMGKRGRGHRALYERCLSRLVDRPRDHIRTERRTLRERPAFWR
jgi:hypothetical protein